MVKSVTLKQSLDDGMLALPVFDFTGGLNSEGDPHDLPTKSSPDCENVRFRPGRLIQRDGWIERADLPNDGDGVAFFYDGNGARRLVTWANGNMYLVNDDFSLTVILSSAYTAGNRITWTTLNKILYWSSNEIWTNSGIRYFDPTVTTSDSPKVVSSGAVSSIDTPGCKCLTSYAGSLVLANLKYVAGTLAVHSVIWSNVNDPTTILGTNLFSIGQGFGGEINSIQPFGVSSVGVTPFRSLFLTKSEFGIYLLKGALAPASLEEVLINCPTGCLDGATVQYIPGSQGQGGFMAFLGYDRKVWWTDGINADELSGPIRKELAQAVSDRFSISASAKFTSIRNDTDFLYVIDIGRDGAATPSSVAYAYDWELKVWTRYRRWPTGYWTQARNSNSENVLYCVTDEHLAQANSGITDGGDGTADATTGGQAIAPYWTTGWLTAGDIDLYKIWKWIYLNYRTTEGGNCTIAARCKLGTGSVASATVTAAEAPMTDAARWDVAQWDVATWVLGSSANLNAYKARARLKLATSGLDDSPESLRGSDCQVQIGTSEKKPWELLGFELFYLPRGRRRVAS